ncbi:unnamed protein product [Alternaria alternata]
MAAHDVEEIWESTYGGIDTTQVEHNNDVHRMPVGVFQWEHDELDIDGPSSSEGRYPDPQSSTGLRFTRAKTGGVNDYGALNLSSGYHRPSPISAFDSPASFMTASSRATFFSARSTYNSPAYMSVSGYNPATRIKTIREDEPPAPGLSAPLVQLHKDYYSRLREREIIQPFDKELNWSGKGQHVTFSDTDVIPLSHISHLGSSMSASVDKVLCRRVALARKTMRCNRRWTVGDALREVYHLQNLHHYHIVQLVGTYFEGRNFSILMYPAADMHLGRFLEDTLDMDMGASMERRIFLSSTLGCLTSAVAFIHGHTTRHMDIKPQNIVVRQASLNKRNPDWRIYIADFGSSRSFSSQDHSQTDGPTSRTPRYCAPEVYKCERRGRSADVFSLGCVFLEILTAICHIDLHKFTDARRGDGDDESFHANLDRTTEWARRNLCASPSNLKDFGWAVADDVVLKFVAELAIGMVAQEPENRLIAAGVCGHLMRGRSILPGPLLISGQARTTEIKHRFFSPKSCCDSGPEPYEAYEPPFGTKPGIIDPSMP